MNTKKKNAKTWNLPKFVFYFFFLCLFLLYIQFAYLSLSNKIYGKDMDKFAANRNTVKKTIKATRGYIYDNSENILALNVSSYTIIAHLEQSKKYMGDNYIKDNETDMVAEKLAPILEVEIDYLKDLLNKGKSNKSYQIEFGSKGKGITELKKDEITSLGIKGLDFVESQKRYYKNGDFASYVIGYAKGEENDESSITGELGIEAKYDDLLKGTDGYLEYQQDRYGYKIAGTKEKKKDSENGYDIHLTIDASIQRFIETAVKEAQSTYNPEWITFTVMDANTGDILGTSSTPSFNPNLRDLTSYENTLVSSPFEPGSTMKIFTYMCALENNVYNGEEKFQSGSFKIGDNTVNDWNQTGWGLITYDKGFEYSSNVGIANLMDKHLNKKQLRDCFKKYGFGKKTDIELTREQTGAINFTYPIEVATAAFGQGITTTPVQQLQALTMLSNDGKMIQPHIVSKIVNPNTKETFYERQIEATEQLVKTSTVKKIKELMYNTVHNRDLGSTGYPYDIPGFDVLGKTGTSQIFDPKLGTYLTGDNSYIFSFSGMFPADDPEIIIYAAMKRPTSGKSKGLYTATKSVMESIAKYKNMFSEKNNSTTDNSHLISSYVNKNINAVKTELETAKLKVIVIGNGDKIIKQSVLPDTKLVENDIIILVTNGNEQKMPNLKGWSRLDVISLCDLLNINYEVEGFGFVVNQSVDVNTIITSETKLKVILESKVVETEKTS